MAANIPAGCDSPQVQSTLAAQIAPAVEHTSREVGDTLVRIRSVLVAVVGVAADRLADGGGRTRAVGAVHIDLRFLPDIAVMAEFGHVQASVLLGRDAVVSVIDGLRRQLD